MEVFFSHGCFVPIGEYPYGYFVCMEECFLWHSVPMAAFLCGCFVLMGLFGGFALMGVFDWVFLFSESICMGVLFPWKCVCVSGLFH